MKKSYIFCTGPLSFLCELPLIFLLVLSIYFNDSADGLLKLYPLIITTAAAIVFIFVFFFRLVVISPEEVKIIGRFTSRSCAVIKKGRTLTLTQYEPHRLKVELFDDGTHAPELEFLKSDPSYKPQGLNLFREISKSASETTLLRVLKGFDINENDLNKIKSCDTYSCKYPAFKLSSERTEESVRVSIEFTKTI